jgi:hypothetical protein
MRAIDVVVVEISASENGAFLTLYGKLIVGPPRDQIGDSDVFLGRCVQKVGQIFNWLAWTSLHKGPGRQAARTRKPGGTF